MKEKIKKKRMKENIIVACSVGAILIAFGCYINVQNDVPETYAGTAYNYPESDKGSGDRAYAIRTFSGLKDEDPVVSHTENPDGSFDIVVDYREGTLNEDQINEMVDEYIKEHENELYAKLPADGSVPEPETDAPQSVEDPLPEKGPGQSAKDPMPAAETDASQSSEEPTPAAAPIAPVEDTVQEPFPDQTPENGDSTNRDETKTRYVLPGGFVDEDGNGMISAASVGAPVYDVVSVTWHVTPIEGEAFLSDSDEVMQKRLHISDGGAVSLYTETTYEDGGSSISPSCFIATKGYLKANGMI